jgi:hypothetical protein
LTGREQKIHHKKLRKNNMVNTVEDYISEEIMIQQLMEDRHLNVEVEWKLDVLLSKSLDDGKSLGDNKQDEFEMKVDQWLGASEESK